LPLKKDPLNPEWAEGLDGAARTTAWYWTTHKLNAIADTLSGGNEEAHFLKLSIAINGKNKATGLPNGWEDRKKFYRIAKKLLGLKGGNV
jgi:putative chitinase